MYTATAINQGTSHTKNFHIIMKSALSRTGHAHGGCTRRFQALGARVAPALACQGCIKTFTINSALILAATDAGKAAAETQMTSKEGGEEQRKARQLLRWGCHAQATPMAVAPAASKHWGPVWHLRWLVRAGQEVLISSSADGRLTQWTLSRVRL